jgi:hypothetical protein
MAETQSSSLNLTEKISAVDANIKNIFDARKNIISKLSEADKSGDTALARQLADESVTLSRALERQEAEYDLLKQEETKPQLEEVRKLSKELEARPSFMPNYMGMGGGGFNAPPVMTDQPSPEEFKARQREVVGQLYNAPVGQGGVESEMLPTSLMAQVATLPNPESKSQLLEKTYGKGNVLPIDLGGNTEFLIKNDDGSVKTTFNKGIAGLAGIAAEAPVVAAEIASFIGTLGATKSPTAAVLASSAVGGGVGSLIDEGLRYSYGLDSDVGGTVARRGTQALIGAGIGGITDIAIPAMRATRIKNPFENEFAKELESAAERLMTREQKLAAKEGRPAGIIQVPAGARLAGPQGVEMQSDLAGRFSGTNIANSARGTQETAVRLLDDFRSGVPVTANDFSDIASKLGAQRNALSSEIAALTGRNKNIIEAAIDRQTKGPLSDVDDLGTILRSSIKDAEDQATATTTAQYDVLAQVADDAGFSISAKELLGYLPRLKGKVNFAGAFDESAVNGVEARLKALALDENKISSIRKMIDSEKNPNTIYELESQIEALRAKDKLDFRAFDAWIRAFNDARPDGGAVGGTTKDVFGVGISAELSQLRRDIYGRTNSTDANQVTRNLGEEFAKATELVRARGAYEKNLLGGILKEAAGEQSKTPRDIVSAVMKEPATINRVVQSLRELGTANPAKAGEANRVLGLLQLQYMNDIGIKPSLRGKGARSIEADRGIANSLFGSSSAAQLRSLESLNRNLRSVGGIDEAKLTIDEVALMGQALSENERKSLASTITKRIQAEKEEGQLVTSEIFKMAQKGNFQNIDPATLSKSILSGFSVAQTSAAMRELSKMSIEARNLYKGDFKRELLDQFKGGTPTANAPFQPLFDTEKFMTAYGPQSKTGKSEFAKKLEIVLGQDGADFLVDLARTYESNAITNVRSKGYAPKGIVSTGTSFFYVPIGNMTDYARNRFIAAMLHSGSNMKALRSALANNSLPGGVNQAYEKMAKEMFMTRQGVEALAYQASGDPEFSAELTNMVKDFKEKQGLEIESE